VATPPSPRWSAAEATAEVSGDLRVVTVGGGSGLSVALSGLKRHVGREIADLAAVVTVADDGGSSGRLRRDFGVPAPGDIRSCLVALADDEDLLARLFQYRFQLGEGLSGHSFGNLFLTAVAGVTGDFYQAVETAEKVLAVRGRILPASLGGDLQLRGRGVSGKQYQGESAVGLSGERLTELVLDPPHAHAFPPAVEALERANLIVLGPGSLHTSIIPNLLIPGIRAAIRRCPAPTVLVANLMTQPGETDDLSLLDHLQAIWQHAGEGLVDVVLINRSPLDPAAVAHYREAGATPVAIDVAAIEAHGVRVVAADLVAPGALVRHDPNHLAEALLGLALEP
jgi:uncharacterized cofD-like protein